MCFLQAGDFTDFDSLIIVKLGFLVMEIFFGYRGGRNLRKIWGFFIMDFI